MKNAWRNQPTSARLQFVSFAEVKNSVIPFVPALEALAKVFFGGTRFQAKESVGEVIAHGIKLGWEIIGFRFAFLTDLCSLIFTLVHVVGDRAHVVKKLAINWPLLVFLPDCCAYQLLTFYIHRILEQEGSFAIHHNIAVAFVNFTIFVGSRGGGSKPSFINAPTMGTVGIKILWCKFDSSAWHKETAWNPSRRQS